MQTRLIAPLGPRALRPLEGAALALSEVLPRLVVEARQVARHLTMGIHGRRRAGPGEAFWQFRPLGEGEPATLIDWRRSARDDRYYVREREWENAAAHWLWIDLSPSMQYSSSLAQAAKRDRAIVLGLALADILVHSGEKVGLLGLTPPLSSRAIIDRLAETLLHHGADAREFPDGVIGRRDRAILITDGIIEPAHFAKDLARLSERGGTGTIALIRDPAEAEFPFSGETEFLGTEGGERWRVGDAGGVAQRYRARIAAHLAELRAIALRRRFLLHSHTTDRGAAEAMLGLAGLIGQAPAESRA